MDILSLSLLELHDGFMKKKFTSQEVTRAYLQQIAEKNEALNAYVLTTQESALEEAAESDKRYAEGKPLSVLDGIPCGLKDIFNTKGVRTTCCSKMLERFVPPYDATAVAKLREAGVVFLGKTNMDEFACGGSSEHSCYGPSMNPVDPSRVAGGSSGGSAAAVAGGLAVFAMGTDTGGSIRLPAAFCGCVGLKPTYGRISRSGVTAMASSLDTVGHFTKTVGDSAAILQVLAGHDPRDATTPDVPVADYLKDLEKGVKGMTIGLPKEYFAEGVDPEIKASVLAAAKVYEQLGAKVIDVSLPATKYAVAMYYIIMPAELSANLARFDGIRFGSRPKQEGESMVDYFYNARGEGFGAEIKRRIMIGTYVLSAGYYDAFYNKALKVRTLIKKDFDRVFGDVDALIMPTTPLTAFKPGEKMEDPLAMYLADALAIPANAAGIPGISIPCGKTASGLPVGLQIFVPQFQEAKLFQVARAYEDALKI
ncbi:MAG: Asp-tRNA(Asn)/Glu-tRNA(Gln) amidotransferase subunit GatA [Candidatus Peregrinibacteria bacterium]|nr:Asp-tRNA(Asn)/Glu-tRNA(Gln) amidotransferase subunit GatA [Candidatus Peregrinibacteria bacterium]